MAFDTDTRNKLAKMVAEARALLRREFTEQLQEIYGIQPDGKLTAIEKLTHLDDQQRDTACVLRERVEHLASGMTGEKKPLQSAVDRMTREQSFTMLNRFAALRMCEERGLLQQCVGGGMNSKGFQVYQQTAGSALGGQYERYRTFLFSVFDEIAVDLGILFDRYSSFGLLFPRETALIGLLEIIDRDELRHIWVEDEAIGWIYQYFNTAEERKAMRKVSSAPRNSRELAVRNQFFTPRYVVEFLTDNTLGRIWYEMRKGDTVLKDECRYLVRRPNEVFLDPGEKAPVDSEGDAYLSQEELLKKTVYIEHRSKKDPRDIRILDPACGSGHFLLYAFDLLEQIYQEAWNDSESPESEVTGKTIREDFDSLDTLRLNVPKLIMEYNLHGIDIDPRAVQIAVLALWLRAQKSWKSIGIKSTERPQVTKSNIVTAEPMPGEKDMKEEFIAGIKPQVLGQIVDAVFERMKLAGEAGSLLKIEEEIKDVLSEAKEQWLKTPKLEQQFLFSGLGTQGQKQQKSKFDLKGITDEAFWEKAEGSIIEALSNYSEEVESVGITRRRLFAEETASGFSFINLCKKRFDVVLTNPPFGEAAPVVQQYISSRIPEGKNDIYAAMVLRCESFMLPKFSMLGAITSRAFVVGRDLRDFRSSILNENRAHLSCLWDLGGGVLDAALVETCAYVLNRGSCSEIRYIDSREVPPEKKSNFDKQAWKIEPLLKFRRSPDCQMVFGNAGEVLSSVQSSIRFIDKSDVTQGLTTEDDSRFIRLKWEINPKHIGSKWFILTKGGEYSWYSSDVHLVVNREHDGNEMAAFAAQNSGNIARTRQSSKHYFKPAVTYSRRSQKGFSARRLRRGCCFSDKSGVIIPRDNSNIWLPVLPIVLSSSIYLDLIHAQSKFGAYEVGAIKRLPWPKNEYTSSLSTTSDIYRLADEIDTYDETTSLFNYFNYNSGHCYKLMDKILSMVQSLLSKAELEISSTLVKHQHANAQQRDVLLSGKPTILSYAFGAIYGRWDIRISLNHSLAPSIPDPFDTLPICPPGMLINSDGLPAKPENIVSEEWLRARKTANKLPSKNIVTHPIIQDSNYPFRISWNGILVDDPGFSDDQPHQEDIVNRLREILDLLWKTNAHEFEQETCDTLGVTDIRDYFRKPSKFFQDHLKRYTKSRRKAPIYWPLSTTSCSYTLWLYYHRLTDQTLYTCVQDYVEPKLKDLFNEITSIQKDLGESGNTKVRNQLEKLMEFQQELTEFKDELMRVAKLPYKPNLNDGVMITAAPLWQLFRHKPWQKTLKDCWSKLESGQYDWAHIAYSIWPDRVRETCKRDRSIAIAHGLEDICEVVPPKKAKKRQKKK